MKKGIAYLVLSCLMALSLVLASCDTTDTTPPPPTNGTSTPDTPTPPSANRIQFCDNEWFLFGINYPWINYGHDFGITAWGHNGVSAVLAGWWRNQTYDDSQGVTKVERSSERTHTGEHSLKLITHLVGEDPNISKGEAFIDLRHNAPSGVEAPVNLEGVTLRCWIYAPEDSGGWASRPNGLQLFVKDEDWKSEYGNWVNIEEGKWNEVTLTPSRQKPHWGSIDPDFDPTRIVMVGVKVATGSDSRAEFDGAFYMDTFKVGDEVWFDFENPSVAEENFEELAGCGVRVVRWFVFGDGRASPEFDDNGMVVGFDDFFYDDMDAALDAAQKQEIYLILVLFDFHLCDIATMEDEVQLGGHGDLITDPAKRQSFIDNALVPMLNRYGDHPNILAWDVMNEPEWAMEIERDENVEEVQPVPAEAMQDFVKECTAIIHQHSEQQVTVGSAKQPWLKYWKDYDLDFYQFHYYDKFEGDYPLDTPYSDLGLDKPCILGEFPTLNTSWPISDFLDIIYRNDYAGVLGWSFRSEDDDYSQFSCEPFREWRQTHPDAPVDIK